MLKVGAFERRGRVARTARNASLFTWGGCDALPTHGVRGNRRRSAQPDLVGDPVALFGDAVVEATGAVIGFCGDPAEDGPAAPLPFRCHDLHQRLGDAAAAPGWRHVEVVDEPADIAGERPEERPVMHQANAGSGAVDGNAAAEPGRGIVQPGPDALAHFRRLRALVEASIGGVELLPVAALSRSYRDYRKLGHGHPAQR